jgi:glutathione S-transferase
MAELTLYIGNKNYSSWSFRPWLAMEATGIAFEERLIPFDFEGGNTAIKAISPSGKVPVLEHGTLQVWETLAILEYLAELFPEKGLWPFDRTMRSQARAAASEMASGFFALRSACPFNMHRPFSSIALNDGLKADIERIDRIWRTCLEKFGGPFLFGAFSAADAMYAPVVSRFETYCLPVSSTAETYMEAVKELPAWKKWRKSALDERWIVSEEERD